MAGEDGELRRVIAANPSLEVSAEVYERIAYRGSTEGVVAQMKVKTMALADLQLPDNPLLMVLERVEKPGNLGAVLRSADAAAADAVIVCDPLTDAITPTSFVRALAPSSPCPPWRAHRSIASPS